MRLKTALEAEIERNRQQQKEYANYIAAITDPQIKQMIELHLNNVSWAKIHAIVYGYSTGGTGANYCYHKVTRYLKKHPMKGGLNDR